MNKNALSELGELIVSKDKLMNVLANNVDSLSDYPSLQAHVSKKHPNFQAYQKLSKEKKKEFYDALDERLGWMIYEMMLDEMMLDEKLDFLVDRAAFLVGDDISKLHSLSLKEFGPDLVVRYLTMICAAVYSQTEERPSYPWLAEKGRWDPAFWSNADKAFIAWEQGYRSHYKLDNWCQENLGCRAPQSCIKFFKTIGDPGQIPQWLEVYGEDA